MHLQLPLLQQLSRQLPEPDAEFKVLCTRRSAIIGQGLPSGRVRQRALALDILSRTLNGLKSAVDAAGGGEGIAARLGARVDGDGIHGVPELVSRASADVATAARIFVVENFIGSQVFDQGKVSRGACRDDG